MCSRSAWQAVAGSVLANNVVKERKASLAEVSSKNDATVKRAAELKPYADFQTIAQERASTVQALASARFDWEQSLRDLSRALPSDVYLSSLKGSLGGGGAGGSGLRTAIGSPALELSGCTRNHPAVATLMSRLRNVQGVTRVSLAKSEKTAVAAGGATTGPCGNKAPPSFEVVVFFEKATVDTALADATGVAAEPAADAAEGRRGRQARRRLGRQARFHPRNQGRLDPVTRRNTILLVAVAAVAAVGAYWMLVLTPKREEAAAIDKQIAVKQAQLASAEAEVATYEQARTRYKANYSMIARLGKAVPADDDVRSLLVQVNSAAKGAGVDFRTISIGGGAVHRPPGRTPPAAAPAVTPPPGATSVGTAGFSTMPFTFAFKGSFFELGKFFNRIDRFVAVKGQGLDVTGRLLLLNSITLVPDAEKGFPSLSADVSANSYLLPSAEGLHRRRDS